MDKSLIAVICSLAGLLLGVGGVLLAFGRAEGRRDHVIDSHAHRLDSHSRQLEDMKGGRVLADNRVTVLEQSVVYMRETLDEVRGDVKEVKALFGATCGPCAAKRQSQ